MKKGRRHKLSDSEYESFCNLIRAKLRAERCHREAWPTHGEIAAMYGLSEIRVHELVRKLKDEGLFVMSHEV